MIRDFWWGDETNKRKVHWIAWEQLILPKSMGGLGFRDMRLFNQALLARQAWRLIQFPDSLCARLLKAKYFPNSELIDAVFLGDSSVTWKSLEYGLQLLKKGLIWRIGDGTKVRIWRDRWIPRESSLMLAGAAGRCRLRWVSQLIKQDDRSWDADLIWRICNPFDAIEILKIKLPQYQTEDFLAWHYEKSGLFSIQSAYKLVLHARLDSNLGSSSSAANGERSIWGSISKTPVPHKIKIFAWRLANKGLATIRNRCSRNLEVDATYRICGMEVEDEFHAVISCMRARALRESLRSCWKLPA